MEPCPLLNLTLKGGIKKFCQPSSLCKNGGIAWKWPRYFLWCTLVVYHYWHCCDLVPLRHWFYLAKAFIAGLPASNGYAVILMILDRFSKILHVFPLKKLNVHGSQTHFLRPCFPVLEGVLHRSGSYPQHLIWFLSPN